LQQIKRFHAALTRLVNIKLSALYQNIAPFGHGCGDRKKISLHATDLFLHSWQNPSVDI
jgi:hypothetical protein